MSRDIRKRSFSMSEGLKKFKRELPEYLREMERGTGGAWEELFSSGLSCYLVALGWTLETLPWGFGDS